MSIERDEQEPQGDESAPQEPSAVDPLSEHVAGMPEPQEHAIEAERADEQPSESREAGTDSAGERFDPEIHQTDENGDPIKTKRGTWKKKPGRKKGSASGESKQRQHQSTLGGAESATPPEEQGPDYYAAARGIMALHYSLSAQLGGGADEAYQGEYVEGVQGWERFCREKGMADFPPSIAVCFFTMSFFMIRYQQRETMRERINKAARGIGSVIKKWKAKRDKRKKKES